MPQGIVLVKRNGNVPVAFVGEILLESRVDVAKLCNEFILLYIQILNPCNRRRIRFRMTDYGGLFVRDIFRYALIVFVGDFLQILCGVFDFPTRCRSMHSDAHHFY